MNLIDGLLHGLNDLTKRVSRLESHSTPYWVYLATPLTSTSWDGDAHATTAKTAIDLSAVFSAPAGIKAVKVRLRVRDAGSYGTNTTWFGLSPNDTADSIMLAVWPGGKVNDAYDETGGDVTCSSTGDIYFQCVATASTMDVHLQIWGYLI